MIASQGNRTFLSVLASTGIILSLVSGLLWLSSIVMTTQAQLDEAKPLSAPISLFPEASTQRQETGISVKSFVTPQPVFPIRDVKPLKEVDISSLGPLSSQDQKLSSNLWQHSFKPDVTLLINNLSMPNYQAERYLLSRLLLAQGQAPQDRSQTQKKVNQKKVSVQTQAYIAARLQALSSLGALEGGNQLIRALPVRAQGEEIAVAKLIFALLSRKDQVACQNVWKNISLYQHPIFVEAQILCALIKDKQQQAALIWQLVSESGKASGYLKVILSAWQAGNQPNFAQKPASVERLSVLEVRLMEQLGFQIPVAHLPSMHYGMMRLMVTSKQISQADKREIMGRLYQVGLVTLNELQSSYLIPVLPTDLIQSIRDGKKISQLGLSPDQQIAALVQAVSATDQQTHQRNWPETKAALIKGYLESFDQQEMVYQMRLVLPSLIVDLDPRVSMRFLTWDAGKALLLAGKSQRAIPWVTVGLSQQDDPAVMLQAARLWLPVSVSSLITSQAMPSHLRWQNQAIDRAIHAWIVFAQQQKKSDDSQIVLRQLKRLLILANMKGAPIAPRHWFRIMSIEQQFGSVSTIEPTSPFLFAALAQAQSGKIGEAILMMLKGIGAKGIGHLPVADLLIVLDILKKTAHPSDIRNFLQCVLYQIMQDL